MIIGNTMELLTRRLPFIRYGSQSLIQLHNPPRLGRGVLGNGGSGRRSFRQMAQNSERDRMLKVLIWMFTTGHKLNLKRITGNLRHYPRLLLFRQHLNP
jgi:hypothetical protein